MPETNLHELIIAVFVELRRSGSGLGIRDLLDALQLADSIEASAPVLLQEKILDLRDNLILLWCRSRTEQQEFFRIWETRQAQMKPSEPPIKEPTTTGEDKKQPDQERAPLPKEHRDTEQQAEPAPSSAAISAVAVKPPSRLPLRAGPAELSGFWPVSRRALEYGWEYLRRPRQDGPATIIDIEATVERAARQGYVLDPVYRQETRDHSHLVLLVDRKGSMTPFHTLARDVVVTAERARQEEKIGRLDVYYFYNVATDSFHKDENLSELAKIEEKPATIEQSLAHCDRETRILIVSDAGAARGRRMLGRIEATDEMLFHLSRKTKFIAWLNPMPERRWSATSASMIAQTVPMFEMTKPGFHGAIRALRGQRRQGER